MGAGRTIGAPEAIQPGEWGCFLQPDQDQGSTWPALGALLMTPVFHREHSSLLLTMRTSRSNRRDEMGLTRQSSQGPRGGPSAPGHPGSQTGGPPDPRTCGRCPPDCTQALRRRGHVGGTLHPFSPPSAHGRLSRRAQPEAAPQPAPGV